MAPCTPLQINERLLLIKVHYFFWHAGCSPVFPYLSAYAREMGFSSMVTGLLYTLMPIIGIITRPILGVVADKFHCQKRIFVLGQILTLLATLAILYVPKLENDRTLVKLELSKEPLLKIVTAQSISNCSLNEYEEFNNITIICNDDRVEMEFGLTTSLNGSFLRNGSLNIPVLSFTHNKKQSFEKCRLDKENTLNKIIGRPQINDEDIINKYWCWIFFLAMLCYWIGQGTVNSIGDAICFTLLEGKQEMYGQQRLFGALGWGIVSAITGYLTDMWSNGSVNKDYRFSFYLSMVLMLIDICVCLSIKYDQPEASNSITKDVCGVFLNFQINVFFLWCICVGICSGLIWQFLYWLIEDLLFKTDCSLRFYTKTLEGLVQTIETIFGEMPFFFISGWIFTKLGHIHTMSLVLLGLGLRLSLYTLISNPWWFLPVELLNGIDVGLTFACMASYASSIAPKGAESTLQSLVGALYEGIGLSVGSFMGGLSYKHYGGVDTFKYYSYFALSAAVLHIVLQCILNYTIKTN